MAYQRDVPLARCPDPKCRRSGVCRNTVSKTPCRRLFMTDDEWRDELACHLERLYVEWGGDPRDLETPPPEPSEEGLAELYNAIAERAAALSAEEKVPPHKPRKRT